MYGTSPPHSSVDDYDDDGGDDRGSVLGTPFSASVMAQWEPDAPPAPTDSAVLPNGEGEGEGGASLASEDFDATPSTPVPGSAPGHPNDEGEDALTLEDLRARALTLEDLRAGALTIEDLRAPSVASAASSSSSRADAAHPLASLVLPGNRARQEQRNQELLAQLQIILPGQTRAYDPLCNVLSRAKDHAEISRGMSPSAVGQKMYSQSFVMVGRPGTGKTTFASRLSEMLNPGLGGTYFFTKRAQEVSSNPGQTVPRLLAQTMKRWKETHARSGASPADRAPIPVICFDEAHRANDNFLESLRTFLGEGFIEVDNQPPVTLPPSWAVIVIWAVNLADKYLRSPLPSRDEHIWLRNAVKAKLISRWFTKKDDQDDSMVRRVLHAGDDSVVLLYPLQGADRYPLCRAALEKVVEYYQLRNITIRYGPDAEVALAHWPDDAQQPICDRVDEKVRNAVGQPPPGTYYLYFNHTDVVVTDARRVLQDPTAYSAAPTAPAQAPAVAAAAVDVCPSLEQWKEYAVNHNGEYLFPMSKSYLMYLYDGCRRKLPENFKRRFDAMRSSLRRTPNTVFKCIGLQLSPTVPCTIKNESWCTVEKMYNAWNPQPKLSASSSPHRGNPHVPIRPSHTSPSATARSQGYFSRSASSPTSEASSASPLVASPTSEAVPVQFGCTSIDSSSSISSISTNCSTITSVNQTETRAQTLGSYSYSSDQPLPSSLVQDLQLQSLPLSPSSQMETDQPSQSHEPNPSKADEEFVDSVLKDDYWLSPSPSPSSSSSSLQSDHDTLTPVASSRLAETEDVEMTDATVAAPPAPSTVPTVPITPQADINDSVIMLPPSFHRVKPSVVTDDDDDDDDDESPMERSFCHSPDDSDEETASHCETSSVTSHASSEASIESLRRSPASTDVESVEAELESIIRMALDTSMKGQTKVRETIKVRRRPNRFDLTMKIRYASLSPSPRP